MIDYDELEGIVGCCFKLGFITFYILFIYLSYSFIFHDTQLKAPPLATMPFASQGTTSQSRYISFNCSIATISLAIPICGTSKKLCQHEEN